MKRIQALERAIHHLHGAKATHRESVPVTEVFQGQTVWDGVVEVFDLDDHPLAHTAYAWSHETDDPKEPVRHVTVLHIPPVVSPITAVRASIARDYRASSQA